MFRVRDRVAGTWQSGDHSGDSGQEPRTRPGQTQPDHQETRNCGGARSAQHV